MTDIGFNSNFIIFIHLPWVPGRAGTPAYLAKLFRPGTSHTNIIIYFSQDPIFNF